MEWPRKETSVRIYGSDIPRCLDRIMKHFSRDLRAWKIDCSLPARPAILQMITGTSSTSPCKHCRVGGLGRTRRWSVNADTEKKYFLLSWDSQAATVKEILSFPIPCFFFFSFHNWKLHPASYCCTARSSGVFSPHSFTASPPSMQAGALRDMLGMLFHHAVCADRPFLSSEGWARQCCAHLGIMPFPITDWKYLAPRKRRCARLPLPHITVSSWRYLMSFLSSS